jgi:hypothetical protein
MSAPGTPPPLRGNSSTHLRVLAAAATRQAEQSSTPAQPGLRFAA